jgi:hypothetical protein
MLMSTGVPKGARISLWHSLRPLLDVLRVSSCDKSWVPAQATTYLQTGEAALSESGEDVAHLLALLPGPRCVGIGSRLMVVSQAWSALLPSLPACQDLRLSGRQLVLPIEVVHIRPFTLQA